MTIKFEQKWDTRYTTVNGIDYRVRKSGRPELTGKYTVSKAGTRTLKYASTLKEAKEIIADWE